MSRSSLNKTMISPNTLGQNTLGQNTLGQNTLGQNTLGQNTLGQKSLGQKSLGPILCLIAVIFVAFARSSQATALPEPQQVPAPQRVSELLPEFSPTRLQVAAAVIRQQPTRQSTEEAARLLWNIRRLPPAVMVAPQQEDPAASDAARAQFVQLRGRAVGLDAVKVPAELAEIIELNRLYRSVLESDRGRLIVVSTAVPTAWGAGRDLNEPVEITGLWVPADQQTPEETGPEEMRDMGTIAGVVFVDQPSWYPALSPTSKWPLGWQILGAAGFDCGLLSGLSERMRQPLAAADERAFYGMLARATAPLQTVPPQTAGLESTPGDSPIPELTATAERVRTPVLLQQPESLVGRWVSVELETARVSRVVVESARARRLLGRDFYWQLDCFGQLPGVRVELAAEQAGESPLVFENRFPVSVAVLELPEPLRAALREGVVGGEVDVRMVRQPIVVSGFFYRLWSYRSDFTESRGGRQVAPLILAGEIIPDPRAEASGAGVAIFGWLMAIGVLAAVVATTLLMWFAGRRDRQMKARRRGLST
ncbi:hypothetical protein SH139x_000897 [Planctomycetaceae bacterium SH139]